MTLPISWASAAILCGVSGCILAVVQIFRRMDRRIDRRIHSYHAAARTRKSAKAESRDETAPTQRPWMERLLRWVVPQDQQKEQLRQRLQYAGYAAPSAMVFFVLGQIILMVGLAGGLFAITRLLPGVSIDWYFPASIGACLGYLLPSAWLRRCKRVRLRILSRSLPDLLDLMVSCLDAGLTLELVIQRIAKEQDFGHELLAEEIQRVQREIELGATADRALQNCAERTDSDDLRALALVCLQARKYGSKIAATLRRHADVLREQREHLAEEAAQKAAVKILVPTMLCLFPVIFVVLAGPAAIQISENLTANDDSDVSGN